MHKKCNICGEDIILKPSAKRRAEKYGGKPSDYLDMFSVHAKCALRKRESETRELMRRNQKGKPE